MMALNTYGDLRRAVATEGLKWTVNPVLSDETVIARPALGLLPGVFPMAEGLPRVNVAALIAETPTTNVLLRSYLVGKGLLPAADTAHGSPLASPGSLNALDTSRAPIIPASGAFGGAGGSAGAPTVDWRNRFGWSWITEIRDQDGCEHCWIYGSTALVEAMVRIEHCVWCTRSEGDYIEANQIWCGHCGNPSDVLNWMQANGVTDLDCVPWVDSDPGDRSGAYWAPWPGGGCSSSGTPPPAWNPCRNRDGRTVKVPAYTSLGNTDDQKSWIDGIGPLVVGFDVWSDFQGWSGNQPYVKSSSATYLGGHVMLAVGYDDTLQCWIVKNSWGTSLGDAGFWLIGYGQCNIDSYSKLGLQYTNPDPWTKRRNHNGGMIESGDGALHRNFELLAPSAGNSFTHWWRDNSSNGLPWAKAETLANDVAAPPTFTATTYNRNFEAVYPTTAGRMHHWYFDQAAQHWDDGEIFGPTDVVGSVGFIESSYGPGNFEVVAAIGSHELQHWWRDGTFTWHQGPTFGSNVAAMGPTLLQSTYGNLELVLVLTSGEMQHWWRADATVAKNWTGDQSFGSGISSPPCMIQGQYGMANEFGNGNFELCVALPNGTVQHWWRDNSGGPFTWTMSATFGSNVARVLALLEGSFGFDLEVIVLLTNGMLQHYWRDGNGWHPGVLIGSTL